MTKRILVTENEKNIILGLHQKAISREFLNEQKTTISEETTQTDIILGDVKNELEKITNPTEKVKYVKNQFLPKINNNSELRKKIESLGLNLNSDDEILTFTTNINDYILPQKN